MAAGDRQSRKKMWYCIKRAGQQLWLLSGVVVLSACQPQPETQLLDYQSRLERLLPQAQLTEQLQKPALAPLPETRTLVLRIPPATIDLTDMLALDVCDLETLIAERNSSLGKVQADSLLLHYELQLLDKLGNCLEKPALAERLDAELRTKLQLIYQQKQQQLPAVFNNLLSRDQTLRQQLTGSQRGVSPGQGGRTETLQALTKLLRLRQLIQQQDYRAASQIDINQALGDLHQTQLIADMQHSLRVAEQFFLQLNRAMATIPNDALCQTDRSVRDNVLTQIFIGRVQTELARLDGIATELNNALLRLYQQHPLQQSVQQRLQAPQQSLQHQLRQHVAFWQRWRQCDNPS